MGWHKGMHHSPETRERMRQAMLGNKLCLGRHLSPETKLKISARARERFGPKVKHDKQGKRGRRALFIDRTQLEDLYVHQHLTSLQIAPILGTTYSTILRRLAQYNIRVTSVQEVRKGTRQSAEARQKMSTTRKNSPTLIAASMRALSVHPNRPEIALLNLLRQVTPVWEFVGDGTVIIGGKSPDFRTNDGSNLLCEMYGDYWHRNDDPQERIDWFAQFGYRTIIVWERELHDPPQVIVRVQQFMSTY